ncbi:MAG: hypothetical protein ABI833_03760 [Acidobacteriota bacterium]
MMALSPSYGYRYAVPKRSDPGTGLGGNFSHGKPKRRTPSLAAAARSGQPQMMVVIILVIELVFVFRGK